RPSCNMTADSVRDGCTCLSSFFFFNGTPVSEIYTLSLHDALPIFITLLNVTLIILTLSVSRLLNLLLRLVASLLFLNSRFKSLRSEERFSRNAETDIVCRLLLEKKKITKWVVVNTCTFPPYPEYTT